MAPDFSALQEDNMKVKQLLVLGASVLASPLCGGAVAQEMKEQYVQVAEIEIEPAQLQDYYTAVKEHIASAIRVEPGVLVLYAVAEKDNPTRVRVFEVYKDMDAYRTHLEAPHFKKYKTATEKMVKSLKLVQTVPIMLGAK
jgi:quinol monooxygenase YgiN